ncbi:hypothetical protein D3C85_1670640 [compost metagenome]
MHPVIGGVRLGPEYGHLVPRQAAGRRQLLDEVVTHHAVTDHQQALLLNPAGGFDDLVIDQVQALAHHLQSLFVSHISLP